MSFIRLAVALAVLPASALAASFTTIATISGSAQIGAVRHGTLYGTVATGQFFRIDADGQGYKLLHSFAAGTDGSHPNPQLAIDAAGNLFGTAQGGGAHGGGTLWEFSAAGRMSTRHAFGANGDGSMPLQGPALGPHNAVYGTASAGAIRGSGSVFGFTGHGYATLYEFQSGADGHCPFAGLAVGKGGALYGMTLGGGGGGNPTGSVWKYTAKGGLRTLYVFQDGDDGEYPDQAPAVDKAGNIYGTTHVQHGGQFAGAIWKISAAGRFSVLHDLAGGTDGYTPNSPLLIDARGDLYGTTQSGGAAGHGTVFRITPGGQFAVVHTFQATNDGGEPTGNLVRNPNGVIYGGTAYGTIFRIVP